MELVRPVVKMETAPRAVGRPTKFVPAEVQMLCECVADGLTYKAACRAARISQETFRTWREEHPELGEAIEEALGNWTPHRAKGNQGCGGKGLASERRMVAAGVPRGLQSPPGQYHAGRAVEPNFARFNDRTTAGTSRTAPPRA